MKVKIKVTQHGYTKTVKMNDGTKLVEKWQRSSHGFSQTDDSVNFEDTELLEETISALGCDFELGDLCDAIQNESAQVYDDEPAVTDDGHTLQRGDEFWTVASTTEDKKWKCVPLRLKFPIDWGSHGSTSFIKRENCIKACDERNAADSR